MNEIVSHCIKELVVLGFSEAEYIAWVESNFEFDLPF